MTNLFVLLGIIGYQEVLIIALIILLLFGGSKIPELMRGIGKGVKAFKDGMAGMDEDAKKEEKKSTKIEEKKTDTDTKKQ